MTQPDILFWDVAGLYFILGLSLRGKSFLAANMPVGDLDEETVMEVISSAPDDMTFGVPDQIFTSGPLH